MEKFHSRDCGKIDSISAFVGGFLLRNKLLFVSKVNRIESELSFYSRFLAEFMLPASLQRLFLNVDEKLELKVKFK